MIHSKLWRDLVAPYLSACFCNQSEASSKSNLLIKSTAKIKRNLEINTYTIRNHRPSRNGFTWNFGLQKCPVRILLVKRSWLRSYSKEVLTKRTRYTLKNLNSNLSVTYRPLTKLQWSTSRKHGQFFML